MKQEPFKRYVREARSLIVEESFTGGMQFTNTPLAEGYCRDLVNFDFKDSGQTLNPRGGYRSAGVKPTALGQSAYPYTCVHASQTQLTDADLTDDARRYLLFCQDIPGQDSFNYDENTRLYVETGAASAAPILEECATHAGDIVSAQLQVARPTSLGMIHSMEPKNMSKRLVHTSLNNVAYYLVKKQEEQSYGIGSLTFARDADGRITSKLAVAPPREVTPTEAINYGYNMMKEDPYAFQDSISAALVANKILLLGVLPYNNVDCQSLLFNAHAGTFVTFRLIAAFPDETSTYKFKWEIRDLESDAITVFDSPDSAGSQTYHYSATDGAAVNASGTKYITLTLQPPYKQFAVTVTAYATTDLTEPINVLVLASYSLTAESKGTTNSIDVKKYDLTTAKDMTTWAQRIVLWGVTGARNILFVSDINDPTYFPYPNNAEILSDNIVACVPYLEDLLIFTETKIYRAAWSVDGLSYTCSIIQDNLSLSSMDVETVRTIKNMVFFKSGNYYYMVVPVTSTIASTSIVTSSVLQLAPISLPIANFLDNFEESVMEIVETMYNPARLTDLQPNERFKLRMEDYYNFLDASALRNVYKFTLCVENTAVGSLRTLLTFDFVLNYNTLLRTWNTYIIEANPQPCRVYRQSATDTTYFTNVVNTADTIEPEEGDPYEGYSSMFELIKCDPLNCQDRFTLEIGELPNGRRFKNWQYIDSGYRAHDVNMKKRYRELQFKINNLDQLTLSFGVEFLVDDMLRKEMYKYTPTIASEDPNSSAFGYINIEREYVEPVVAPGATILEDVEHTDPFVSPVMLSSGEYIDSNKFVLSFSKLSSAVTSKVRLPVSGKGYLPRVKLVSFNETRYEYLTQNWVCRTMNGR